MDKISPRPDGPEAPAREAVAGAALDRVLLYMRGLDIPPVRALELALESFRRLSESGVSTTIPKAMEELRRLLRENDLSAGGEGRLEPPRASMPPLNRCSMIAKEMKFLRSRRPSGKRRSDQADGNPEIPAAVIYEPR